MPDMALFAYTVCALSDEETERAQIAIAWTIINRADHACRHVALRDEPHPLFGDGSIPAACRSHGIASPAAEPLCDLSDRRFCRALSIASLSLCADLGDPTDGATHFHDHRAAPAWAACRRATALIGRKIFYRPAD